MITITQQNRFWPIAQYVAIAIVNSLLFLLSLYCLWGWVTVSDIKAQSEKHGYDFDRVMASMVSESTNANFGRGTTSETVTLSPKDESLFKRLKIGESASIQRSVTNNLGQPMIELFEIKVGYLDPFFRVSDNVVNLVFTFGVGYVMSSVLVMLALLKKKPVAKSFILLRPLAGAMVSVCLFVVVLSGGRILWESAAHPNGLSVGIIAAIGSLYCERFDKILAKSLPGRGTLEQTDRRSS